MKLRSLTPKSFSSYPVLKTAESQSNKPQLNPSSKQIKKIFLPEQYTKMRSQYQNNQVKPISAKMGKQKGNEGGDLKYKCGCIKRSYNVKPEININVDIKSREGGWSKGKIGKQIRNRSLDYTKHPTISSPISLIKPKLKRSASLSMILSKLTNLYSSYQSLLLPSSPSPSSKYTLKYVPKEIIKSIDKIKQIQRPIELKVRKVKKIPKEIIKYKEVEQVVPVYKEQLVFVDAERVGREEVEYRSVEKEVVKEVEMRVSNEENRRMEEALRGLRWRREKCQGEIEMSMEEMEGLRREIEQVRFNKELVKSRLQYEVKQFQYQIQQSQNYQEQQVDLMTLTQREHLHIPLFPSALSITAPPPPPLPKQLNISIQTTNVNHSIDNILIRSKSEPMRSSNYLSYKARLIVNGKEEKGEMASLKNIMVPEKEEGKRGEVIQISSSPEIVIQKERCQERERLCLKKGQEYNFKVRKI